MELQIAIKKNRLVLKSLFSTKYYFRKNPFVFVTLITSLTITSDVFLEKKNVGSHFFKTQTIGHMKGLKFDADIRRMR